ELAHWVLSSPAVFCFTFLHWHPEDAPHEERGSRVRRLVQEVLEKGEHEGVLVPGSAAAKACLVWGTLTDLARVAVRQPGVLAAEDVVASAQTLWRALAR
ncbi:TetR/AcrR family transcriptional regulator, partial [Pyxidicoccus sp. 3LG]